jgi:hypothetical protein
VATIQTAPGLLLVVEAAIVGALRSFMETRPAAAEAYPRARQELTRRASSSLSDKTPVVARIFVRAILTLALLLGLMNSVVEATVALIGVLGIMIGGALLLPRMTAFTNLIGRIPIAIRLLVAVVIGGLAGYLITSLFFGTTQSLFPILLAALVSIAIMTISLPEAAMSFLHPGSGQPSTR